MKLIIEADSIAADRMSGIGHATLEMLQELNKLLAKGKLAKVTAVVPFGTKQKVAARHGLEHISFRSLPPGYRYVNYALTRTNLPLCADLFFGRGVYIFPNYKTWHLAFSKSLTFVHDLAFKIYPETINPKNLIYLEANFQRWLQRATKVITISENTAHEFDEAFPVYKNKVAVIHLGVSTEVYYRRPSNEITAVRKKWQLPKDYLLYVGNLEPRKNLVRLLEAYQMYYDNHTSARGLVVIGGDGWKDQPIKNKITDLQKQGYPVVHPRQYVPDADLPAIYSGAKGLVHLALHEGFGLTALEAMATQTPVLVSDIRVMHEVAGPAALFAKPTDTKAISAKIATLADDQTVRNRLVTAGTKRVSSFSWKQTVGRLVKCAEQVTGKANG